MPKPSRISLAGRFWPTLFRISSTASAGAPFQTPFAKPPGEGLSSSTVNVLWGFFNIVIGYILIWRVGDFDLRYTPHVAAAGTGALLLSVMMARHFGRFHGGNSKTS